jgi:predicted nucleotidyltransferase
VDVPARVTEVLAPSPQVVRVELVGSRARGEETALSDWDYRVDATNGAALARELTTLVDRLELRWDISVPRRLGDEVSFALVRHGVI